MSPLLTADHRGLPSTLILTADHDPLRDDGRRYADALRDAGVPVRHIGFADSTHGFVSVPSLCHAAVPALDAIVTAPQGGPDGQHAASRLVSG